MKTQIKHILAILLLAVILSVESHATETAANETEQKIGKFLGAKQSTFPDWFKESFLEFEEDIDEATAENKRLMLYFHQDGCPYCNQLIENNFNNAEIGEKVRNHFDVIAINMWGDKEVVQVGGQAFTEKTLAAALKVNFTPTLLFFNEQKKVALRLDGYYPPAEFVQALDYVAEKREQQISFTDYSASKRQAVGDLITEEWIEKPPFNLQTIQSGRPVALLFEEPACHQCEILHQQIFRDPAIKAILDKYHVIQLNRWSDTALTLSDGSQITAKKLADKLGVSYAPSMALFDRDGGLAIQVNAQFRSFHIRGALQYVATNSHQTEPSFQRYLNQYAEDIRHQGEDVDLWKY